MKEKKISLRETLELIDPSKKENVEECAWNRFIFLDFVLYFGQLHNYYSDLSSEENIELLKLRDHFYTRWMATLEYGVKTGLAERENEELAGLSVAQFLDRGSKQFSFLEKISSMLNRPPKTDHKKEEKRVQRMVYDHTQARTPFSTLFPIFSLEKGMKPRVQQAISCTTKALENYSCQKSLSTVVNSCTQGDSYLNLIILGVFSSQRMYLIRDFKGYLEQNLTEEEFSPLFEALKNSSKIYFQLETLATVCGTDSVYPTPTEKKDSRSAKAYHFWSVAYISYYLTVAGFPKEIVLEEATRTAKKYKSFIRIPGVYYNLWLGLKLNSNTVGDYKQVLSEQAEGALFGYNYALKTMMGPIGPINIR